MKEKRDKREGTSGKGQAGKGEEIICILTKKPKFNKKRYQKCFQKILGDLKVNLFRAPRRSIIPLKSKIFYDFKEGGGKIRVSELIYTPGKMFVNGLFWKQLLNCTFFSGFALSQD